VTELAALAIEERGDLVVARITGELDVLMAPRMGEEISEAVPNSARGLVMDLSQLEFIDSSGVSMLFTLARKLGSRRQDLRVVATPGGPVIRVLELVEFARAAPVHEELESALA
jgi:anti-anti-sigma factor